MEKDAAGYPQGHTHPGTSRTSPAAYPTSSTVLRGRGGSNVSLLPDLVRAGSPDPPVRLTAGLQVTRRWSGTGRPAVAVGGGSREPRPTNLDKTDSSPVLNERPVEISRGFWNSSAVGTRKWVQPTAAQLGIALLFLSTRSPSLNLIERRVKVTLRCAYAVAGSRFFRHFHATIQWALGATSNQRHFATDPFEGLNPPPIRRR